MKKAWQLTVWGVRGSFPMPSPEYMEYGGNTVCTSLSHDGHIVIFDAGTGLSALGQALVSREDVTRVDILLSHFHMDHLLGLFSFPLLFRADMEIRLHGGDDLSDRLAALTGPPYWPLPLTDCAAELTFHTFCPGDSFDLDGLTVSTMAGNHPGGSILYRLDGDGKRVTCALDCETDETAISALTGFARESSLLIWDAGFTQSDLRPGWGHSTWEQGLALGRAADVGQVLMTHFGRTYTDAFLRRQEALAQQDPRCLFAKEGLVITL